MILAFLVRRRQRWLIASGLALLLLLACTAGANAAQGDNGTCLGCHNNKDLSVKLASGEVLPLFVEPSVFNASIHGIKGLTCVSCHANISGYPHPKVTAGDRRSFQLERYTQCQTCHPAQYKGTLDSNHARALAGGNRNAAICTDCHGSHSITNPKSPRQKISTTCQKCHSKIYDQYAGSVHGKALAETSNPDVPTCTDCHGSHQQSDPTTTAFRLKSPELCAKCHANQALMRKYSLSTDVFNSYVADFHGTTVELFERQTPDQPSNKAVCLDCHGVHDIASVRGVAPAVVKEKLLVTCQKCHPDATTAFPDSWVGHFPPSRDHFPLVYYVNLFYYILLPTVLGGMALFVLLDVFRRIVDRIKGRGHHPTGSQGA
jgi:predicted CXXCH cytochrome family protein